jgi:NAD(P)-dependent dehydrogenase (short-subunit alcohol dehydrogenase family)
MTGQRLDGVVAVVTGGNSGIGEATCRRLARDGAQVAIGYLDNEPRAAQLAAELSARGPACLAVYGNVRETASVQAMIEQVRAGLGPVGALVNNAGIGTSSPFGELSEKDWEVMLDTNLTGAFRCVQAVLPDMLAAGAGSVVSISSELALTGGAQRAHYVAAKAGLIGLTMSLAREYGRRDIRFNVVAPGPTDTPLLGPSGRAPAYVDTLPMGRIGRPEEIAAAVAFMCSPDASYCTGQVLSPNGGAVI